MLVTVVIANASSVKEGALKGFQKVSARVSKMKRLKISMEHSVLQHVSLTHPVTELKQQNRIDYSNQVFTKQSGKIYMLNDCEWAHSFVEQSQWFVIATITNIYSFPQVPKQFLKSGAMHTLQFRMQTFILIKPTKVQYTCVHLNKIV